jgi:hypothetical protein
MDFQVIFKNYLLTIQIHTILSVNMDLNIGHKSSALLFARAFVNICRKILYSIKISHMFIFFSSFSRICLRYFSRSRIFSKLAIKSEMSSPLSNNTSV